MDSLTYTITSFPERGELTGGNSSWTYRPAPAFYGDDHFTFKVNDGREDSNEATVRITVKALNDPPEVSIEPPLKVALGFPMLLRATFLDDPASSYTARVTWGDGRSGATGDIVDANGIGPELQGVVVTNPPLTGVEGHAFATHVYEAAGSRMLTLCIKDDGGLEGCDSLQINVERLVNLGFGGIVYEQPLPEDEITEQEILDGVPFTYEVTVQNGKPSVGSGLKAEGVVLDVTLPADLNVAGIAISQGSCAVAGVGLTCAIGDLDPEASALLKVRAFGPGTLVANAARDLNGVLTTLSPAIEREVEFVVNVDIVPNLADDDGDGMTEGFERAFGLDPARDDARGDADGDGLENRAEFDLRTSPRAADTDGDGLTDFAEHAAGNSDPTKADTDGDGLLDGWEVSYGLSPMNAGDAAEDPDADGLANADEFVQGKDPRRDDVPPLVRAPADITVVATGRRTRVAIGAATAVDGRDGPVSVQADTHGPFLPGPNIVGWSAEDALDNLGIAEQRVNVIPLATFAVDQSIAEGGTANVRVELNGPAVSYPVTIPYSVAGSADNAVDYVLTSGTLSIASGIGGEIKIDTLTDAVADPDETIVLTLGVPANAARGEKTTHTITIRERNLAPQVNVRVEQQERLVTTIARDRGRLIVNADVIDGPRDQHSYDWSRSDRGIFDLARAKDQRYELDALTLNPGVYALRVDVADNGLPPARSDARTLLRVVDRPPLLNPLDDSDSDGVDDLTEGSADRDGDRVADYLDAIDNPNLMSLDESGRAVETNTGLGLRLGERAFALDSRHVAIAEDDVMTDVDYGYVNGVADFEITGLELGGRADVVIPLLRPVTGGAVYRKLLYGVWQDFAVGGGERIASAPGSDGVCPPPGSALYQTGLGLGHGCLQLTLADGGPNDADGFANGIIRDPGGLAVPVAVDVEVLPPPRTVLSGVGDAVMLRLKLHTDSGDVVLRSLTLQADGTGRERDIEEVQVVHDVDGDGVAGPRDPIVARGAYRQNSGVLSLELSNDLEVPFGTTDVLVVYRIGGAVR